MMKVVVWGDAVPDAGRLCSDLQRICEAQARMFGGQAGRGTRFGMEQTKRIGFDTVDILTDPLDIDQVADRGCLNGCKVRTEGDQPDRSRVPEIVSALGP